MYKNEMLKAVFDGNEIYILLLEIKLWFKVKYFIDDWCWTNLQSLMH